jgi:hypothetical protein
MLKMEDQMPITSEKSVNKVVINNETVMDVTDTTATPDTVLQGQVFYKANGDRAVGTYEDADTKNTAGATDTASKIFLVGAPTQTAEPQTYTDDEVYATSGVLTAKSMQVGGGAATLSFNSETQTIDITFA